ncbi:TetR/AcrR family transcriptional regulator [Vogesella oryzae]|uniref:TetR/AcrR family transcriptional regulator n=1 Tax=Vogesella oryzae TaxID=1735285 RepID=UPI00158322BB|nr:TetR/AcrR family transcriptional regulator [Vogesella oryzae]
MNQTALSTDLAMRRTPRQQRSQEAKRKIELATLALLAEQGYPALNTNAIAARAGVGIKSLYHLFPNKEAIICQLASGWLEAVNAVKQELTQQDLALPALLDALDAALERLDEQFGGYGPLWQGMDLVPALKELETQHEARQIAYWSERLRHYGCRWPPAELAALAQYYYRMSDTGMQYAKEGGTEGKTIWQLHRQWLQWLLQRAVAEPDPAQVWPAGLPPLAAAR